MVFDRLNQIYHSCTRIHPKLRDLTRVCAVMAEEAPWNFSWIVDKKLAAMAWPQTEDNLRYILGAGVTHLITLSPEMLPPVHTSPTLGWTLIAVPEFQAPSLNQISQFISICEETEKNNGAVGIHCRMGRGRTGVMAACYLVRFMSQSPERAVTTVRLSRPGSVETYAQERVVVAYYDALRGTKH